MFMLSARFTVAGDYLVCAPVQYLSEGSDKLSDYSTLSYIVLFNPASGEFINTQAILSGGVPGSASIVVAGDTLYVWGEESADLSGDSSEFFRSLSLAKWIGGGDEPTPNPEPDTDVAPSANNAEGVAAASVLADTSDKASVLVLEAALALLLATCVAAATQIKRKAASKRKE
jgi:hypothetical protein